MAILSVESGGNVFLQGNRLAVGIGVTGSFGTSINAPAGFFTDTANGFTKLGIYADADGFGRGTLPNFRDVTLPGSPEERFNIGYRTTPGGTAVTYTNSDLVGGRGTALPPVEVEVLSRGSTLSARWTGRDAAGLEVQQVVSFDANDTYMKVTITLTNTSSAALYDVRYMRNVDPDQAPGFQTANRIFGQNPGGALVAAFVPGDGGGGFGANGTTPFFFYSGDSRAVVAQYGFTNTDPYATQFTTGIQPEGTTATADSGVAIGFNVGTLAAGASTTLTFYLGVAVDLDEVIDTIVPDIIEEGGDPIAVNDVRIIAEDARTLAERSVTGNVLVNDSDPDRGDRLHVSELNGDALGRSRVLEGRFGTLTLAADGSYSYAFSNTNALIAGERGVERFTYTVSDGDGNTDSAVLEITINGSDLDLAQGGLFVAHRGDDEITGGARADRLAGRAGDDALDGGAGDDVLWGEDGDDTISTGSGDDQGIGGDGDDTIHLGLGEDRGWGQDGNDVIHGEGGADRVDGGAGNDRLLLGDGDDRGWGRAGDDVIEGGAGEDWLIGGTGDDALSGGSGDDRLWGEDGEDLITGGSGADEISAGDGADTIVMDAGNDVAWGGAGADRFVFAAGSGRDRINDFGAGDRIVLDGVYGSFARVQANMATVEGDVVITLPGGGSITVAGVAQLDRGDFVFI